MPPIPLPPVSSPALPFVTMAHLLRGVFGSQLIGVATMLGIPEALKDGPRSSGELAQVVGADASSLHRVLRGLVLYGVLGEPEPGRFALSPLGQLLLPGAPGGMDDYARATHEVMVRSLGSLLDAVKTGRSAFEIAFGRPFFAHLATEPAIGALFDRLMSSVNAAVAAAVPAAYSFAGVRRLVDVGGGRGHYLASILAANPHLEGVLLEAPPVAPAAEAYLGSQGLLSRCSVVAGDFFESVPAGDAYLLAWILHDWDDERCSRILQSCRHAVAPGGKLLVVEQILPERVEEDPAAILGDIDMLVLLSGRERRLGEYRALLEGAGFRMGRVHPVVDPLGRPLRSILEAVAV